MPPKKDTTGGEATKLLIGFEDKETKLIAAAFVSCIGPDKVSDSSVHMLRDLAHSASNNATATLLAYILHATCRQVNSSQYDYDLMSTLTGNTNGSLKKMWPPVKKKAIDAHASFATFLGSTGANITAASSDAKPAPAPRATGGRKRKAAADADIEVDAETKDEPKSAGAKSNKSDGDKSDIKTKTETKKKAPAAKGRGRSKKAKKDELSDEKVKSEDSADGSGQYTRKQKVLDWLSSTD